MNAEEKYQAELKQADIDHHTPTAGAMIGHIISNLHIQQNKLNQSRYYLKGAAKDFADTEFSRILQEESELFDQLNQLMLDEGEVIPTTSAEFTKYSMLVESGQLKYEDSQVIIFDGVKDFNTQLLFITRGIALAEKEQKYALAEFLKSLYGWMKHQIYLLQSWLGHDVLTGLVEDDEDED